MKLRTIAILRGHDPSEAVSVAERCWAAGMDLVEVPVQGEQGWRALEAVARRAANGVLGAGTVLSGKDARRAVDAGAAVIISPSLDPEVIEVAQSSGAVPLPGVMTPTETAGAVRLGVTTCKLFPASVLGAEAVAAFNGPFPQMDFVAVGGVDPGNVHEFIAGGASGVAFGGSIGALLALDEPAAFVAEIHKRADGAAAR